MTVTSNISTVTVSLITVLPIFLDNNEVSIAISRKNTEPWKTAYNQFITTANSKLTMPTKSVTSGGPAPPTGDKHSYYSSPPGGDRTDYNAAMDVCKAVRDLGLAYVFTNENKYADKAIQLINGWCLDGWNPTSSNPDGINPNSTGTYMRPTWWYTASGIPNQNRQQLIESYVTFPSMFYGASLIWGYSGWNSSQKDKFKNWVTRYLKNPHSVGLTCDSAWSQNFDSWASVFGLSAAIIIDDMTEFNWNIQRWKNLPDCQQDTDGSFPNERGRGEGGWAYSMYNLVAWVTAAEIARHKGVDLYGYKAAGGKGIELALDFHAQYVTRAITNYKPTGWPYTGCTQSDTSKCRGVGCSDDAGGALYEPAYKYFPTKTAYKNAILYTINNTCGRPKTDTRTMGPVTLTHGI